MSRKMLIDFSQMCFKSFFVMERVEMQVDYDFWRYNIFLQIQKLLKEFRPDEVVLCCDSKSWRKEYCEYYKANRKHGDHVEMFEETNAFMDELKDCFPYKIIRTFGAEADDVIAVLTLTKKEEDFIYIVSNDHDFIQLLCHDKEKILLYDIKKEEMIGDDFPCTIKKKEFDSPEDYINWHILSGDSGDGVTNILSDADTFIVPGKRLNTFGHKKYLGIKKYGMVKWIDEQFDEIKENIERNTKLIKLSLKTIPKNIQEKILLEYNKSIQVVDKEKILNYLKDKDMRTFFKKVEDLII